MKDGRKHYRSVLAAFIGARTTRAEFAQQIGCKESHLSLILNGKRGPSLELAKRISEATEGLVPMEAFAE